jgi:hypothetical protein
MTMRAAGLAVLIAATSIAAGCGDGGGNNASDKGIALTVAKKGPVTATTKAGTANTIGNIDVNVDPSHPAGGQAVAVRTFGHAVQDSHFLTFLHSATSGCRGTVDEEFGNGANHAFTQWLDDAAVGAGNNYSSTASFVEGDGVAWRICAYLQNPMDTTSLPYAFKQVAICPRGQVESGNGCRPETSGPASLALAANPSNPGTSSNVNIAESGRANRDGILEVFRQPASQSCRNTRSNERQNAGASTLNNRSVNAGDLIAETHGFQTSSSLASYRICGYVGPADGSSSPDATADLLVCAAGATLSNNSCVTAPTLTYPNAPTTNPTTVRSSNPPPVIPTLRCGSGTHLAGNLCVANRHRTHHRRRHRRHRRTHK